MLVTVKMQFRASFIYDVSEEESTACLTFLRYSIRDHIT
jgi:hypothetical protein